MKFNAGNYDVAVIGAGHAGIEASLASARLGCSTVVFTISLDFIGNMPCNPSIGGTSKGHLVREIDALGGEMAKAADASAIQIRMLNRGKGPAVHSLRAQADRRRYSEYMKAALERCPGLDVKQAEIVSLQKAEDGGFILETRLGAEYRARAVILATGTFLDGKVYVGENAYMSGPDGVFPSVGLADSLKKMGLPLRRFKTGTPSRVNRRSVDFSDLQTQYGDELEYGFSFEGKAPVNKAVCYIAYTNDDTKKVILDNIDRSPLYGGKIEGIGPRYCPSIEDKIVRFPDKERHQLFIEPCGENTEEMYLQGMSSSLPEDVQLAFLRTIHGLENVSVMRNAYAIEYDCTDPVALRPTLEYIEVPGLYGAGQYNGSSGYEEAAAQGLVAGINAGLKIKGREPVIFPRSGSYIGTLIDDLVTKGCGEPYRMMTSRSEYRLYLRQDNADLRLTPIGHEIGLIGEERYAAFLEKKNAIEREMKRAASVIIPRTDELNAALAAAGEVPLEKGVRMSDLLKRPGVSMKLLEPFDVTRPEGVGQDVLEQVEIGLKYEGYIKKQLASVKEAKRLESKLLPDDLDYHEIRGLRLEAAEKLSKIRPENIGQASRISGVSPADIDVLLIWLRYHQSPYQESSAQDP